MPPKGSTKKAVAAPKAGEKATTIKKTTAAAKKETATAKASTTTTTKTAVKKTSTTTKAAVNGTAPASKKRKADESEDEDKENVPKPKKARTKAAAPVTKPAAAKKETAAPAAKAKSTTAKSTTKKEAPKEKAAPAKASTKKKTIAGAAPKTTKRKATPAADEESDEEEEQKVAEKAKAKKPKAAPKKKAAVHREPVAQKHPHTIGAKLNDVPTKVLDVYVFGEGSSGELGLGSKKVDNKKPIDVKRPRLNPNLDAEKVGVVQIACGGMHVAALTKDNKILTWGVNDQGALGRDTNWDGGLRDMDAGSGDESEDEDDDTGINPKESTPIEVPTDGFAAGAKFVQVVASDSATFALTEDGRVYGWGTFRSSDGILGFSATVKVQQTPAYIPELRYITALSAGSNHVLALDKKGKVWAWGCGQQNQLGRRIIERNKMSSLVPQGMGLPTKHITKIACGQYHSFAIDDAGRVYTWGLNNFGETGIREGAGEDDAVILRPEVVEALEDYKIVDIAGGQHHSLACSEDGKLLTWGRFDGFQAGLKEDEVDADDLIRDDNNTARILAVPTVVPSVPNAIRVAAGTDNNFAVTAEGKAYSWGFSSNYQTGQGTFDDVEAPTMIDNTAVRDKKLVYAGAGGQFSILCGEP